MHNAFNFHFYLDFSYYKATLTDTEINQRKLLEMAKQHKEAEIEEFDEIFQQIVTEDTRLNAMNTDRSQNNDHLSNSMGSGKFHPHMLSKASKSIQNNQDSNNTLLVSRNKNNQTVLTKVHVNETTDNS